MKLQNAMLIHKTQYKTILRNMNYRTHHIINLNDATLFHNIKSYCPMQNQTIKMALTRHGSLTELGLAFIYRRFSER